MISLSSRVSVDACERMRGRKRGGRSVVIQERCIVALREEERERAKAMPHSATLATRLGAELKARILPQRGDAALAPHKSSCFCSEQGGENRWSPLSPPLPSSRAYQPDLAYFIYPARYSAKLPLRGHLLLPDTIFVLSPVLALEQRKTSHAGFRDFLRASTRQESVLRRKSPFSWERYTCNGNTFYRERRRLDVTK